MSTNRENSGPSVVMLTTTTTPYVYHIPAILSCPTGIPYWFRYANSYLSSELLGATQNEIRGYPGILYLRDNDHPDQICYPVRRFTVLWHENVQVVSFFNFRLGDEIQYVRVPVEADELRDNTAAEQDSLKVLRQVLAKSRNEELNPKMRWLGVPAAGEPAIRSESDLRKHFPIIEAGDEEYTKPGTYVWLTNNSAVIRNPPGKPPGHEGVHSWAAQVASYVQVKALRHVCFFHVSKVRQRTSAQSVPVEPLTKDDSRGKYTHGLNISVGQYQVDLVQMMPTAFSEERFDTNHFSITIKGSTPGITPVIDECDIDGTYGRYEVSFEAHADHAGEEALLRLQCTQPLKTTDDRSATIPATVIPVKIASQWVRSLVFSGLAFLALLLGAETPQLTKGTGAEAYGSFVQAFCFAVALALADFGSIGSLVKKLVKP